MICEKRPTKTKEGPFQPFFTHCTTVTVEITDWL